MKNQKVENYLFLASVFFLPLLQIVSYVCWALLFVVYILNRKKLQFSLKIFWFYYLFFALHLAGVLISDHMREAWSDLIVKTPLILFPILFFPLLNNELIEKVKSTFIAGCFVAAVYLLGKAMINYHHTGESSYFYYINYSTYLHPTFFTIFINMALLFLFEKLAVEKNKKPLAKFLIVAVIVFFMINVYLAWARLSQVAVIITLSFYFFLLIKSKNYFVKGAFITGVLLVIGLLVSNNDRFLQLKDAHLDEHNTDPALSDSSYFNSTRTRSILFEAGIAVFKKHPVTGTGLANYDDDFRSYLLDHNYPYLAKKFTGPHSQYLETAILLGIPGLIMILYIYIGNIFKFLRRRNHLAASFALIFAINALGEYTLRASGILIFCLFIVLFEWQGRDYDSQDKAASV